MEQRNKIIYIGSIVILAMVGVGFFITPLLDIFLRNQRAIITFGRYGSRDISYVAGNFFSEAVDTAAFQFTQQNQGLDTFTTRLIWREGFNSTLTHIAILDELERSGMDISTAALDRRIAGHVRFQRDGRFDADSYRALNAQQRSRFRALERERYLREQYLSDITEALLISSGESDFFRDSALEERRIVAAVATNEQIDDDLVRQYVAENPELFERIRLAVIEVTGSEREVQEIRAQIEDDGSNFFEKQNEIEGAGDEEIAAESEWYFFAELPTLYRGADGLEMLRGASLRRVLDPIAYGEERYLIFLIEERQSYQNVDEEDLYSYARDYIDLEDREYINERLIALLEEQRATVSAAEGGSLVEAAALSELPVVTSEFFPLNYGNLDLYPGIESDDEGYLDGVEINREFLAAVFSLEEGELSQPIAHRDNFLLLQVTDIEEIPEDEFEDFGDFYGRQLGVYIENDLEDLVVRRDIIFDNFDQIYDEVIAPTVRDPETQ